jgi:protein SCO1/2
MRRRIGKAMKSYGLALVAALALAAGCTRSEPAASAPAANGERRFPLTGEVVRVEPERSVIVVRHDEVKGFMPAMTMDFKVDAGDLALARPGLSIRADLVAPAGGDFRLEKIWPNDKVSSDTVAAAARKLREDTHNLGKGAYREVGESAPIFALYDQDGEVVQSARFSGKQIMLNFIFTRCPDATMCLAATSKMNSVQKLATAAGVKNLELVSITLDPDYDTPGVLHAYANAHGIDTKNFSFLTGPESAIKDLLLQFGVLSDLKGGIGQHTLATLLINEQGQIRHRVDGRQWQPNDFVSRMAK